MLRNRNSDLNLTTFREVTLFLFSMKFRLYKQIFDPREVGHEARRAPRIERCIRSLFLASEISTVVASLHP